MSIIGITEEELSFLFEALFDSLSEPECEILGVFRESSTISPYEVQKVTEWSYSKCHRTMKTLETKHLISSHLKPSKKSGLQRIYSLSNLGKLMFSHYQIPGVA